MLTHTDLFSLPCPTLSESDSDLINQSSTFRSMRSGYVHVLWDCLLRVPFLGVKGKPKGNHTFSGPTLRQTMGASHRSQRPNRSAHKHQPKGSESKCQKGVNTSKGTWTLRDKPRSSSREVRIRVPFFSVVYFSRGTLVKGHY